VDYEELKQRRVEKDRNFIARQAIYTVKFAAVQEAERIAQEKPGREEAGAAARDPERVNN
jgi:hypothetical protein